jgi:hypothetical protein
MGESEFYEPCCRRSGLQNFDDVYAQVVIVSRIYNADLCTLDHGRKRPNRVSTFQPG